MHVLRYKYQDMGVCYLHTCVFGQNMECITAMHWLVFVRVHVCALYEPNERQRTCEAGLCNYMRAVGVERELCACVNNENVHVLTIKYG
jgi:hypothetical protein